jgi:hypothetical protein
MPEIAKPNPYDKPNLREAWKEGRAAFQEEKPPPDEHLFNGPEEMTAYLEGYLAAQGHEEKHDQEEKHGGE